MNGMKINAKGAGFRQHLLKQNKYSMDIVEKGAA